MKLFGAVSLCRLLLITLLLSSVACSAGERDGEDPFTSIVPRYESRLAPAGYSVLADDSSSESGDVVPATYEALEPADGVPPSPVADSVVADLLKRLSDVEKQLKKRDDADKRTADAAAKKFTVRPFGRVHIDAVSFNQDQNNKATVGTALSGADFRRARFGLEGEGFEVFSYRFDVDFVSLDSNSNNTVSTNKRPVVVDCYFDTQSLPVIGNLRVGRFREPFGLDRMDSTNDLPFMERALVTNALVPFRNLGVMGFNCNEAETATWAAGVFAQNSNAYGESLPIHGGIAFTGRATWLPWYDEPSEGRYLFHLGTSYSYRLLSNQQTRFGAQPEAILKQDTPATLLQTPRFVNTPILNMIDNHTVGFEASTMLGSLAIEGEYVFVAGDQINNPNLFFHGGYVEAMYFLTGEHRNYDRKVGYHRAMALNNNFFRVKTDEGIQTSWGAWEATARFSTLDLNSKNINGGRLNEVTLGMNWYYTVRSRIMFNYIHAFLDAKGLNTVATNSNCDIFAVRYQWAF